MIKSLILNTLFALIILTSIDIIAEEVYWGLSANKDKMNSEYILEPSISKSGWVAKQYYGILDMLGTPWTLSGTFQTANSNNVKNQYLVGTRHVASNYTGWALSFHDGRIRLMAVANNGKGKQIISSERYDDAKKHTFILKYQPTITELIVDDKVIGKVENIGDLGNDNRRRFAIGVLLDKGKDSVPFEGELSGFKFQFESADATKLDVALKNQENQIPDTTWIDISKSYPDMINGKGWKSEIAPFRRLPERYKSVVRPPVWGLSTHSTGIYLRFKTVDAASWGIRWTLTTNAFMPHMTPLGTNGLDVYAKIDGKNWTWAASARPSKTDKVNTVNPLIRLPKPMPMEFMVYLPLYTGVEKIEITLPSGGRIEPIADTELPIVFYGTSLTQGCSASRPGMVYTAILGRRLDRPVINLGFSGNGTLDAEFIDILSEIKSAMFILDGQGNMISFSEDEVKKRLIDTITGLRKRNPSTPIVVIESPLRNNPKYDGKPRIGDHRAITRPTVLELQKSISGLYLIDGDELGGRDTEATIDGAHFTDLGFVRYADAVEPILRKILK